MDKFVENRFPSLNNKLKNECIARLRKEKIIIDYGFVETNCDIRLNFEKIIITERGTVICYVRINNKDKYFVYYLNTKLPDYFVLLFEHFKIVDVAQNRVILKYHELITAIKLFKHDTSVIKLLLDINKLSVCHSFELSMLLEDKIKERDKLLEQNVDLNLQIINLQAKNSELTEKTDELYKTIKYKKHKIA